MAKVFFIKSDDMGGIVKNMEALNPKLVNAFKRSTAEFGAYMEYSAAIELGAEIIHKASRPAAVREAAAERRRQKLGIQLKGVATVTRSPTKTTVKIRARPHILPAVDESKKDILRVLMLTTDDIIRNIGKGGNLNAKAAVRDAWIRALNDVPRRLAVQKTAELKIFEFGFHRRSIRGYSPRRSPAQVQSEQNVASRERKGAA